MFGLSSTDPLLPQPTDEQLLEEHLAGSETAFRQLVERYRVELFRYLARFLGDRALADDVFQETFVQVHQSADQFDRTRRFRPWLFAVAANKARDALRFNARRPSSSLNAPQGATEKSPLNLLPSRENLPDEPMAADELRRQVQRVVQSMPPHYREILLLAYFNQFSYKQISDILEIPVGTVKSRLHAAVAFFAQQWKSSNPGGWVS